MLRVSRWSCLVAGDCSVASQLTQSSRSVDAQELEVFMLVLFDTPAGHALFKVKKPDKIKDADSMAKSFADVDSAQKL